jgi:two-component system sensor histidine kinase MtrB
MRLTLEFFEDEENAASLRAEIMEMEKIVASLLEAERLNERHAKLTRTRVVVAELVVELLDDFFDRERDRITVQQPEQPVIAEIDEARVTLMLKNLVTNALRYSSPSDGPVELSFETSPGELVFRVRDRGPGMPVEQAARIGEPFYRADPSRARSSGGTGLGLYLASLVARAHGGTLALIASDGPGACMEVRLPIAS